MAATKAGHRHPVARLHDGQRLLLQGRKARVGLQDVQAALVFLAHPRQGLRALHLFEPLKRIGSGIRHGAGNRGGVGGGGLGQGRLDGRQSGQQSQQWRCGKQRQAGAWGVAGIFHRREYGIGVAAAAGATYMPLNKPA